MTTRLPLHISNQMFFHRTRKSLSFSELARRTGIERRRLGAIERRQRTTNFKEALLISRALGFKTEALRTASRSAPALPVLPIQKLYLPKADRPFAVRLREARRQYPALLRRLEAKLLQRDDIEELTSFLQDTPVDSSLEVTAILSLLASGFGFNFDSPGRYGYHGKAVIDPKSQNNITAWRRPMIHTRNIVLFPQVSFRLTRVVRVDFLACLLKEDRTTSWCIIEVDGPGHSPDHTRELLSHPTLRFTEPDVLAPNFPDRLVTRVRHELEERVFQIHSAF